MASFQEINDMVNILSTLFVILLVGGSVVCDSELFPVSMFKDATETAEGDPEWTSDNKDTEPPMGKSATTLPASTQQLNLDPDILWIENEIVKNYEFKKHPQKDEWVQQPSFENSLIAKTKELTAFTLLAGKAQEFFTQTENNDWDRSKKTRSCINLLYITAARYLLVAYILYEQSGTRLTACQEVRDDYGKLISLVIPDSGVCFPKPYGSATCKSDYDVGLIGKDAGFLTKKFNDFFEITFGKPSELVFDTNVYAFTLEFAMPSIFQKLPPGFAKSVAQKEQTVNFKMQELASAYYKVFKYNKGFSDALTSGAINEMGQKFKDSLNSWLAAFQNLDNQSPMRHFEGISLKDFRKTHNDQYQLRVETMSNNGGYNAENLGFLAEALLYAAEAYHTRGAIRHVVGGMQLKVMGRLVQYNNPLSTHDLWVSMIENWGESNKEYNHCNQDPVPTLNKCFLKMSKYLSRMFNAMRLLRTRVPPNDRFTLLDFGDPKDPEYASLMWLRYKKEGKTEIPEDTNNRIRLFLEKFECQAAAKTQNLGSIKLSPECLGNIQKNVNLYNVKLAGALTQG